MVAINIGERLRDLADAANLGQKALAAIAGRTVNTVSEWMRGNTKPPTSALERLARYFGLPLEVFAEGGPMPSERLDKSVWRGLQFDEKGNLVPRSTGVSERGIPYLTSATLKVVDDEELKALSSTELLRLARAMADMLPAEPGDRLRVVLRHLALALERERSVAGQSAGDR